MSEHKNNSPDQHSAVSLREITRETVRVITDLGVSPKQDGMVAPNAVSISQAYFDREVAWVRAVYADDTPVGFLMLHDNPEEEKYYLWRFMIDQRFQGFGFGRRALELLFEVVRSRPGGKMLLTSCVPFEGGPGPFYEKMGFKYTGEKDGIELLMRRQL